MGKTRIVWAKKGGGVYWPAKVVEEQIKDKVTENVYKFNGKKWGKLTKSGFQIANWDCKEKEDYIKVGKNLPTRIQKQTFTQACKQAEWKFKHQAFSADNEQQQQPKRRKRQDVMKNKMASKRQKSDQNQNQICTTLTKDSPPTFDVDEEGTDDDDDDLPAPFLPIEKPPEKMEKGNVVWAKFKDEPYWPAVFYNMDKKLKIWVYFFDETWKIQDMKRIILQVKDVIPFCCGQEKKDMIMKEGSSLDHENYGKEQFLQSVKFAEEYLASKASGKITNFFTYESEEEFLYDGASQDESSTPGKNRKDSKRKIEKEKTPTKFKDLLASQPRGDASARQRHKNLLKAIDKTQPTLKKILSEEIDCERHKIFKSGTASQKNMLKHQSGYGPIDDDKIAEKLLNKLVDWFLACDNPNNFNSVTYVSEVWLPEAIILALMDSRSISRKQAEKVFGCSG